MENDLLNNQISSLEDQVRLLVIDLSQDAPTQPPMQFYDRGVHPHSSSHVDRFTAGASHSGLLVVGPSYERRSLHEHGYSKQYIRPSQI